MCLNIFPLFGWWFRPWKRLPLILIFHIFLIIFSSWWTFRSRWLPMHLFLLMKIRRRLFSTFPIRITILIFHPRFLWIRKRFFDHIIITIRGRLNILIWLSQEFKWISFYVPTSIALPWLICIEISEWSSNTCKTLIFTTNRAINFNFEMWATLYHTYWTSILNISIYIWFHNAFLLTLK